MLDLVADRLSRPPGVLIAGAYARKTLDLLPGGVLLRHRVRRTRHAPLSMDVRNEWLAKIDATVPPRSVLVNWRSARS